MADDDKLVIRSYLLPKKEEDEYLFIYVKDKVCNIMKIKKKKNNNNNCSRKKTL